jgi:hypothetical protein
MSIFRSLFCRTKTPQQAANAGTISSWHWMGKLNGAFRCYGALAGILFLTLGAHTGSKKPNILIIFGDDVGPTDISAYSLGLRGFRTPNIDRIAGMGKGFFYADGMWEMDQDVGKLLKLLDDLHIADGTIVMFTSDNGANLWAWPDTVENEDFGQRRFLGNILRFAKGNRPIGLGEYRSRFRPIADWEQRKSE